MTLSPSRKVQTISDRLEQVGIILRGQHLSKSWLWGTKCWKSHKRWIPALRQRTCPFFLTPLKTSTLLLPLPSQEQHLEFAPHFAIQWLWVRCACWHLRHHWVVRLRLPANAQCIKSGSDSVPLSRKMFWTVLGGSQRHLENFPLCCSPAFLPISSGSHSCLSQESLQLVNLWGCSAPHGPQLALLQPQRDPLLGKGATPPAVSLRADLVHGGNVDLVLEVELVQPVGQIMHRAGAQRTTVFSRLVDRVFRPLGSDVDVSAGGERERHFNSLLRHHFEVFSKKKKGAI